MDLDFSIIVSTRDRAERLRVCLAHLARLSGPWPREFLLVDNGSRDHSRAVIEAFRAAAADPVTLIDEPRPGIGHGYAAALAKARGRIVVFTDDDCYADPGLLTAYAAAFEDPALGFVGGRIRLFDPDDIAMTVKDDPAPKDVPPRSFVPPGLIHGANMAVRRAALLQIGGVDSDFGAGAPYSGLDVDICARASAAGWRGRYDPAPLVAHHHGRKRADAPALASRYARGGGAYFAKLFLDGSTPLRDALAILWFTSRITARHPSHIFFAARGFLSYLRLRRRRAQTELRLACDA